MINLLKRKDGSVNVQREGNDLICPFFAPMPAQNAVGQMQFTHTVCGNHCPHFKYEGKTLTLGCGTTVHTVSEVRNEPHAQIIAMK